MSLLCVREEYRLTVDVAAIRVRRDPNTMILEVSVSDRDPQIAVNTCNSLVRVYIERRMMMAAMKLEPLEKSPGDADLQKRMRELELERRMQRNDVQLLDPCRMPR